LEESKADSIVSLGVGRYTDYGHIRADCENLKQSKGSSFNTTLSDDSDGDETPGKDSNHLAFTASYDSQNESNNYYSKNSGSEDEQNEL
jgi:hypothetical protein